MSFPQSIGGVTYNQSDFNLLGYLAALPNLMGSIALQEQSASCFTIGSAINFTAPATFTGTVATNLALYPGCPCMVHLTSSPTTAYYAGQINSYDSTTGAIQLVYTAILHVGVGSGAATVIPFAGPSDNSGFDNSGTPQDPVMLDRGGLGNTEGNTVDGYFNLGIGSPVMHMSEIYEEFADGLGDNPYNDYYPWSVVSTVASPMTQLGAIPNLQLLATIATQDPGKADGGLGGSLALNPGYGLVGFYKTPIFSTSFFYGSKPWLCLDAGGDVYLEFSVTVTNLGNTTSTDFIRFGLAGTTSSRTGNVFSRCGIGFLVSGGYLFCVYSAYGNSMVLPTFSPAINVNHTCRIEIYRAAGIIAWFIDNIEVARVSYLNQISTLNHVPLVTQGMTQAVAPLVVHQIGSSISPVEAMMWPVISMDAQAAQAQTGVYFDYMYVKNMLQRYQP